MEPAARGIYELPAGPSASQQSTLPMGSTCRWRFICRRKPARCRPSRCTAHRCTWSNGGIPSASRRRYAPLAAAEWHRVASLRTQGETMRTARYASRYVLKAGVMWGAGRHAGDAVELPRWGVRRVLPQGAVRTAVLQARVQVHAVVRGGVRRQHRSSGAREDRLLPGRKEVDERIVLHGRIVEQRHSVEFKLEAGPPRAPNSSQRCQIVAKS